MMREPAAGPDSGADSGPVSGPVSAAFPLRYPGPPPKSAGVVVLGGGVIGVMTAWFLALRGERVVLCEKGRIAGEQSSRNWGWVRQQGRDFAELPISMESLRLWQGLAAELGPGLGFRQAGVIYAARTEAEMAGFEAWRQGAAARGLTDTRLLTRAGIDAQVPGGASPWLGGMITPSDARAEPFAAVPLLAAGAVARGAVIVEGCAVRALDIAAGRVAGVVTEQGRIACEQVVVAGGAWSSLFLRAHGVVIPQLSVRATVARTAPLPQVFAGCLADDRFAFRRRQDGGYTIAPGATHDFHLGPDAFRHLRPFLPVLRKDWRSTRFHAAAPAGFPDGWTTPRRWAADETSPFERCRVLDPAPNPAVLREVREAFAAALPGLGAPTVVQAWAGMIDTLPDLVPVIGRVPAPEGLVLATGLCGHGFGIGPGMGRVVASLVAGDDPGHDLARFRPGRFADGSHLEPGPSL